MAHAAQAIKLVVLDLVLMATRAIVTCRKAEVESRGPNAATVGLPSQPAALVMLLMATRASAM